jgi:hypothetical protein
MYIETTIPATARRGICEQGTVKSTARGSHNKQNPNLSKGLNKTHHCIAKGILFSYFIEKEVIVSA